MKPNERNTTKSVTFDEEKNIVREFSKHSKIEKGGAPKYQKENEEESTGGNRGGRNSARSDKEKGNGPKSKKEKKANR